MSLKGGLSGTEIRNAIKSNNLSKYVEDGTISTEQYQRILQIYGVVPERSTPSNSLKGSVSNTQLLNIVDDARSGDKEAINKLSKYVDRGVIPTELYEELVTEYGAIPAGENPSRDVRLPKQQYKRKSIMKVLRNVLAVVVGLISYIFIEVIATYIFALLLKIPVLSFLMTSYIPIDIFLTVSVASSASLTTAHIIRLISSYKSVNYSAIIVFLILLSLYLVSFFNHITTTGFTLLKLELVLITAGFMVVGCFSATEKD